MKQMDVRCPQCGTVNRNLYLWETDGWFECECCGCSAQAVIAYGKIIGYRTEKTEVKEPAMAVN